MIVILYYKLELLHFYNYCRHTGKNTSDVPSTLRTALKRTNSLMFPNMHTILRIMLTFPVTTCTCERSIAVLNRIKSYNRTTQLDDRLTGHSMICAYSDTEIDWDKVINTFANKYPRRMMFINILEDDKV